MGCFHGTCGLSGVAIPWKTPARMMLIGPARKNWRKDHTITTPFQLYQPLSFLVKGTYNDYGGLFCEQSEKDRFFNSIRLVYSEEFEDRHRHPEDDETQIYGSLELHEGQSLWFIRESAFQMIDRLPYHFGRYEGENETLGESIAVRRAAIEKAVKDSVTNTDQWGLPDFDVREEFNMATGQGELNMEFRTFVVGRFHKAKENIEPFMRLVDDYLDLFRINMAMEILRQTLVPMNGAGSQDFDTDAYKMLADEIKLACKEWDDAFEED